MSAKLKPRAQQLRHMWATKDFFRKLGVVEKLVRDEGALYYFVVPVIVIPLDSANTITSALEVALERLEASCPPAGGSTEAAVMDVRAALKLLPRVTRRKRT